MDGPIQPQALAEKIFKWLQPYCIAIYLGGSRCSPYIKNPHDIDFICFADKPIDMCHIRRLLHFYFLDNPVDELCDFIQVRCKQREEFAYGSYNNRLMKKLVGEDINFKVDIIRKDRAQYIKILKETINKLDKGIIGNQKRWYQVLYGYFIVLNRSYELTPEQVEIINIVHDQQKGWEKYKINAAQLEQLMEE